VLIALLDTDAVEGALPGLADVLVDCVDGGASVGFLAGLTAQDAADWWRSALRSPALRTWVAWDDAGSVVGCVLLAREQRDNGRHRAEVRKLLVHRRARGGGVGRSLMEHVERDASDQGCTLLMLDTETGSSAEKLYLRSGWTPLGTVTGHAYRPDGSLGDTTFMVKHLDGV
jgi:acetyltransferase